jgi:hypothetical protein
MSEEAQPYQRWVLYENDKKLTEVLPESVRIEDEEEELSRENMEGRPFPTPARLEDEFEEMRDPDDGPKGGGPSSSSSPSSLSSPFPYQPGVLLERGTFSAISQV